MARIMATINNLHPASKIVLHHIGKSGNSLRGSSDLNALIDSHLQLSKTENDSSVFTHIKSRCSKALDDFAVDWIEKKGTLEFVYSKYY